MGTSENRTVDQIKAEAFDRVVGMILNGYSHPRIEEQVRASAAYIEGLQEIAGRPVVLAKIEGGMVTRVISEIPITLHTLDSDVEGRDDDEITILDDQEFLVTSFDSELDVRLTQQTNDEIKRQEDAR